MFISCNRNSRLVEIFPIFQGYCWQPQNLTCPKLIYKRFPFMEAGFSRPAILLWSSFRTGLACQINIPQWWLSLGSLMLCYRPPCEPAEDRNKIREHVSIKSHCGWYEYFRSDVAPTPYMVAQLPHTPPAHKPKTTLLSLILGATNLARTPQSINLLSQIVRQETPNSLWSPPFFC